MKAPKHMPLEDLVPMMCTLEEKCISDYLNHAIKFLKKEGRSFYSKESVEKIERSVKKYILPSLKPLYKEYCLDDEDTNVEITITIGNTTIPLNELEGQNLKDVLKQLEENDKISDFFGKKRSKKIKFEKKRSHEIIKDILDEKILPEIKKWDKEAVEKVEGVLNGLEPGELDDLPEKTIKDTLKSFGDKKNKWDKLQGRTIAKKVKKALGNCSKWNKTTIEDVNSILPGFTPDDLKNFTKKSIVLTIKTFANQTGWDITQARTLLKTLKKKVSKGRRLAATGDGYGPDVSEWTGSEVNGLGTLCVGLTESDILALSASAILSFPKEGFESLKDDAAINALAARVQSMSATDVASFDQEQVDAMPSSVKAAYDNVAATDDGDDDSNTVMFIGIGAGAVVGIALIAAAVVMNKGKKKGPQKYTSNELDTRDTKYIGNPARV